MGCGIYNVLFIYGFQIFKMEMDLAQVLALEGADEEEFLLLYSHSPAQRSRPMYHQYREFSLDDYTDEESFVLFRFHKEEIERLCNCFSIPEKFTSRSGTTMKGQDAFLVMLRRLAYPNRYSDTCPMFGREIPECYRQLCQYI